MSDPGGLHNWKLKLPKKSFSGACQLVVPVQMFKILASCITMIRCKIM